MVRWIAVELPLFIGFYTSQVVVWDFWTINSIVDVLVYNNRLLIGAPRKVIIYNIQTARKLYFYIPHQMPFRKCLQRDTKGQLLGSQLMEKKIAERSGDYKEKTLYTWNLFCPLFWGFNPPKEGLFQSIKTGVVRVPGRSRFNHPASKLEQTQTAFIGQYDLIGLIATRVHICEGIHEWNASYL